MCAAFTRSHHPHTRTIHPPLYQPPHPLHPSIAAPCLTPNSLQSEVAYEYFRDAFAVSIGAEAKAGQQVRRKEVRERKELEQMRRVPCCLLPSTHTVDSSSYPISGREMVVFSGLSEMCKEGEPYLGAGAGKQVLQLQAVCGWLQHCGQDPCCGNMPPLLSCCRC